MSFFLTFVAVDALPDALPVDPVGPAEWLAPGRAVAFPVSARPDIRALRALLAADKVDVFITPAANRRKKLLIADMDSTIVSSETLDEVAHHAGVGEAVAAITTRSMNGELDFSQSMTERVAMIKGRSADLLQTVLEETKLNGGALTLVRTMAKYGATCALVSGGFTFYTQAIAQLCGFHHHHGNVLDVEDDIITGLINGDILDKNAKKKHLESYARSLHVDISECMAIGDGANDLPMLETAGLGIGYHPKKILADTLDNCIFYNDLTAALFAQGYAAENFVVSP